MMKYLSLRPSRRLLSLFVVLALYLSADLMASSVRIQGHIPEKAIAHATIGNRLDGNTSVNVTFVLPLRDQEDLEQLIHKLHDPSDSAYGKYLTSEEFIDRFAPTEEDYNKIVAYATSSGLTVENTHSNRQLLNVSGTAEAIESAFNLNLYEYHLPSGRKFFAPNNNPEVPAEIVSTIRGIVGLDNHAVWHSYLRKNETKGTVHPHAKSAHAFPSGPGGGFSPSDIIKAYNLSGISADGTGQAIALFELAAYELSDINEYANYFKLGTPELVNVLVDGGSVSDPNGGNGEVTLDIELALALAPKSKIYVYEGPNSNQGVLDTYNKIATDNLAKQISTSWGMGENLETTQFIQAESAIFQQMAAQGQTIYAAAGDSGAYDDYANNSSTALVVDDPASQPYVVGVGGTKLIVNSSTGAYISESVWNDGLGNGAGGGGVSTVWTIPSWQQNIPTCSSSTKRNVPDVCLNADPETGYAIFYNGQWTIFGGTSCAAPLWSAFTACVNQKLAENQKPSLGFANPKLYTLGKESSSYKTNFHDVTTGNNYYYRAGSSYDNASGWGSINGQGLFGSLTNSSSLLNILFKHSSYFKKGGSGTYTIIVTNYGNNPTNGPVTVTVTLPNGLSYSSFSGSGWVKGASLAFTQSSVLSPGASFSALTLNVKVSANPPYLVTPSATVSGGGSASCTVTNPTTFM